MKTPTDPATTPRALRTLAGKMLSLLVVLSLAFYISVRAVPATAARDQGANKRPVILLTGFEPFGKEKPANPSWEGIKALDGREWRGYQLVCKQLPVVWGAPLENLQSWIAQYQPVAIFSFGQGGKDAFAFESKAANQRGRGKDNRGELAPQPTIVGDGPTAFRASIDCETLSSMLGDKGYKTRVSTVAGRYLCEEALYSLEYLKTAKKLEATVMFCHVPPLNGKISDRTVTPEYVQGFVEELLVSWHTVYHNENPAEAAPQKAQGSRQGEIKEIQDFIGRYFSTWSNQDMKGYDGCFLPDASIQHIDGQGGLSTSSRKDFIASQRDYHRNSPVKTTEVAESIEIRFEEKLARVVVYWKLTAGPRIEYGYDHFTLIRHQGSWRIVNLVFYGVEKKRP